MKKWNKDYKPESFSDLLKPILNMAKKVLADKNNIKNFKYDGYPLDKLCAVTSPSPDYYENAENRKDMAADGKSNLEMMLMVAMQIGIEQGGRIYKERHSMEEKMLNSLFDEMSDYLKNQKKPSPQAQLLMIQLKNYNSLKNN